LWLIVALMAVQTLLTHLVLVMIFGDPLWVWIVCGVDAYAVIWILGFYASMVVIPHRVNRNDLRLRYGFLKEIVVPRAAILRVRPVRYAERKPGKLLVDGTGEAMFTSGEATAAIQLDPDVALRFRCRPVPERINTLYVTADAQDEFVAAVAGDLRPTENAN
jgi:hypothetical protein